LLNLLAPDNRLLLKCSHPFVKATLIFSIFAVASPLNQLIKFADAINHCTLISAYKTIFLFSYLATALPSSLHCLRRVNNCNEYFLLLWPLAADNILVTPDAIAQCTATAAATPSPLSAIHPALPVLLVKVFFCHSKVMPLPWQST